MWRKQPGICAGSDPESVPEAAPVCSERREPAGKQREYWPFGQFTSGFCTGKITDRRTKGTAEESKTQTEEQIKEDRWNPADSEQEGECYAGTDENDC
ncbi:Fe2+ transport system [Clostridium sp. SY8519]|nr:Fe2+ transport system [Clostridium sp. SY8519]